MDSIRALFSEKEKELSLAVAKVEALTRQLEDLRKDRRGPLNLITGAGQKGNGAANGTNNGAVNSPSAKELDKLRRELMVSFSFFFSFPFMTFLWSLPFFSTETNYPCNKTLVSICNGKRCNSDNPNFGRWT